MRILFLILLGFLGSKSLLAQAHISVDSATYDFGSIQQGVSVEHTFRIRNTGDQPLVISAVEPACGCVTVSYPKQPLMPGDSASIGVKFLSKGKNGFQLRSAAVYSNADNSTIQLYMKGEVLQ